MKNYEKEIKEEAIKYAKNQWDGINTNKGTIEISEDDFEAGVNSEIAAKIREDEAVEFVLWIRANYVLYVDGLWQLEKDRKAPLKNAKDLYKLFLNSKTNPIGSNRI